MAITSAQQSAVFKLAVGLFNAAPGGFYNSVAGMLLSSKDAAEAADKLIATDAFQAIIPSNLLTNEQFAARLVQNLVGDAATQANKDWAAAQIVGQLNAGKTLGEAAYWAIDSLANVSTSDSNWGAAAATLLNKIAVAQHFTVEAPVTSQSLATLQGLLIDVTSDAGSVAVAKAAGTNSINLSTAVETSYGTSGADTFKAFLANGANTLQSGDVIRGGAGSDTLLADISTQGTGENAIAFETSSVEKVTLRAQHATSNNNNGDNNLAAAKVAVDGERAVAVQTWHNYNSRADLIIEDVRIADGAKTKDVAIVMESTDPGNVDFGVYFDQHSLRNSGTGTTTLTIKLMDTGAAGSNDADTAAKPLLNNPYDQFKLGINGVLTVIQLDKTAVAAADTYEALLTVFQNALASTAGVTVALGNDFSIIDPISNKTVTGKEIVLTGTQGIAITAPQGSGWYNTTGASVPPTSNIYTTYADAATSTTELVTSTIVLDDVGRGSTGGDLVVGGLSVGATSTSRGVERFEIEVRDNSKLQTINSTNDALREVVIVNGVTTNTEQNQGAYDKTATNAGNLTVNGNANITNAVEGQTVAQTGSDTKLPGLDDSHHGSYGFTDVRLIDGSAMTGKLAFNAQITNNSITKYVNKVDGQGNPVADVAGAGNVNYNVKGANFVYSGGANNDTMSVVIAGDAAASQLSGRHDFTFQMNGGAGNDTITVNINPSTASANWLTDQRQNANITINAGDGDDVVKTPGSGDIVINAGGGNDTVYTDNTGNKATWVVNATNTNVSDLAGQAVSNNFLYKGQLVVSFTGAAVGGGITSAAADSVAAPYDNGYEVVVDIPTGTNYLVNQFYINQAIKAAVNGNAVLSKLLVAQDGPADTLTITSLGDGAYAATDLSLTVRTQTLTATQQAEALAALKLFNKDSSLAAGAEVAANTATAATLNGLIGFSAAGNGAGSVLGTAVVDVAAVTETHTVTIGAGIVAGENISVNGLTINTAAGLNAAQVEQILETGIAAGDAVLTGSYNSAWTVGTGAAGTVVYTSTTAGTNVADLVSVDSTTGTIAVAAVQGAAATTTTTTLTGSQSTADTDNTIDMGAGTDVLVLSSSNAANEILKMTGYNQGKTTVVNFEDGSVVVGSQDYLDFSAYLTSKSSASGSVESQRVIATTMNGDAVASANEVIVLSALTFDDSVATSTFAGLTEAKLLAALNTTNNAAYAGITDGSLNALNAQAATAVVGGLGAAVVLVENNQNRGEYAAFELTWNAAHATSTDFTAAKLIGYIDFGNDVALSVQGNGLIG